MMRVLFASLFVAAGSGFAPTGKQQHPARPLHGIAEWRDLEFENLPSSNQASESSGSESLPKSICLLPFCYTQVLLQGETKQLRLYEDRFISLFEDVMDNHEGTVGMALLANEGGIIQTVPLCQVEAYNRMEGFGIFVTIRVVSRAHLLDLVGLDDPEQVYIKAVCRELSEEFPPSGLEMPNLLADTIEASMVTLSALEHKLERGSSVDSASEATKSPEEEDMNRRIQIAKLDDKYFADDDDEDEEDEEEALPVDRRRRYQQAFTVAMDTDVQGYTSSSGAASGQQLRSPKELVAVSWAAFMTEILSEQDATFRIQAMDETNVLDRLKLASYMLREKKDRLQNQLDESSKKEDDEEGDDQLPS